MDSHDRSAITRKCIKTKISKKREHMSPILANVILSKTVMEKWNLVVFVMFTMNKDFSHCYEDNTSGKWEAISRRLTSTSDLTLQLCNTYPDYWNWLLKISRTDRCIRTWVRTFHPHSWKTLFLVTHTLLSSPTSSRKASRQTLNIFVDMDYFKGTNFCSIDSSKIEDHSLSEKKNSSVFQVIAFLPTTEQFSAFWKKNGIFCSANQFPATRMIFLV